MALVTVVSLELAARALFRPVTHRALAEVRAELEEPVSEAFDVDELGGERLEVKESGGIWIQSKVLHPFFGFAGNPDFRAGFGWGQLNEFGFFGAPPPVTADEDEVIVAMTGGSVAMGFGFHVLRHPDFLRALEAHASFAGKRIRFVSLALDGMKQPQQLMVLNYFLVLGHRIDYLINLDGFNEIALPWTENVAAGVYPFYPRAWQWYAAKSVDRTQAQLLGRILESRERALRRHSRLASSPLGRSALALLFWELGEVRRRQREVSWERRFLEASPVQPVKATGAQASGPGYVAESMDRVLADSVEVWKQGSLQMRRLCEANGIVYLHALQPNQYLAGSKPLSRDEQRRAIAGPGKGFRPSAEHGYPLLREAGRELAAAGVAFEDLTDAFAGVREPLYVDLCCHFNRRGFEYVAERIARRLPELVPAAAPE